MSNKMTRMFYVTGARTLTARDIGSKTMMVLRNGVFIGYTDLK
jgi:hypothetical protein